MNIDTNLWLAIIGVALTCYSLYLGLRKKKYPGKLTLIKENSVGLFNELSNNFDEIKIEFKNKPIDKNIIYIKGSIVNNGEIDLNLKNSETPVGISINNDLKWIKSKITKSSSNVSCTATIEDTHFLGFDCGYLRINEFFQFEALIETTNAKYDSSNIFDNLSPKHRLISTQKINVSNYLNVKERHVKRNKVKSYLRTLLIIIGVFALGAIYKSIYATSINFEYRYENQMYTAKALTDNTVTVINIESAIENSITATEFHEKYIPVIPIKTNKDHWMESFWNILILSVLYSLTVAYDFNQIRKSKQLSNIIEKENN